jgi:O-antigen ligase
VLVTYIKYFTLFLFVFVSFNDATATEFLGGSIIKLAFGLFVLTHAKELYEMLGEPKTRVVKAFFIFIFTISLITLITYFFKQDNMYITDMIKIYFMRILSFFVIFVYVTYTKNFKLLLYMIWFSLVVSSIIAANSDPYEDWTFRRVGGTDNPNDFAAQLLPTMFATYYLFKQNRNWIFLIGSELLFVYTLIYAGSKSSFLVLAVLTLFIFVVRFREIMGAIATPKGLGALVLFIAISVGGAWYMSNSTAVKGLEERSKSTGTMHQRFVIWEAGGDMIRENFFLGVGFAQFPKVSYKYINDYLPPEAYPSHNNFIKVFAESGVFSFLAYLFFIITLFTTKVKEIYSSDHFWIYVGSLSVVLMSLTIPSLHHKDYWWTLALVSYSIYYFYKKEENFS